MTTTSSHVAGRGLGTLRAAVTGGVFVPGDDGYDEARRAWNLAVDERPAVVVAAESAADVVAAVGFAAASAVLPPASYHRLQKIKASYDPGQAIISAHPVQPSVEWQHSGVR